MNGDTAKRVIIVGGGIVGVTTLYEFAARGVSALLVEAQDDFALGCSFANGGVLTPSAPDPWNSPGVGGHLAQSLFNPHSAVKLRLKAIPGLTRWGLKFLANASPARHRESTFANYLLASYSTFETEKLVARLGLQYSLSSAGALKIFDAPAALNASLALTERLAPYGLEYEVLNREETLAREPLLAGAQKPIAGGIYYPGDRTGDAREFTLALARAALDLGAEIIMSTSVENLVVCKGAVVGVATSNQDVIEGDVVLAAGADAPSLTHEAGLHLPIKPAKGYSLTFEGAPLCGHMPGLPVIDDAMHAVVVPFKDKLRVVGTAEFAGFDTSIRSERIENLYSLLERLFPGLARKAEGATRKSWAGLRPMSADGRPMIGASPVDGLWLNCGHGHLGWTMAAGSAKMLVDQFMGRDPAIEQAHFYPSPSRLGG